MLKKNKPENEFHECEDFDPAAWEVKKKLFNANRYFINLVLFLIGAGGYFSPLPYPAIVKTSWLVLFLILGFCLRIAFEWERVPVLRLGKYKHTKGPGLFFLAPGLDKDHSVCRLQDHCDRFLGRTRADLRRRSCFR